MGGRNFGKLMQTFAAFGAGTGSADPVNTARGYCVEKKIPVEASMKKPYSMDRNLLHISYEAGMLEDPWLDASAPKY